MSNLRLSADSSRAQDDCSEFTLTQLQQFSLRDDFRTVREAFAKVGVTFEFALNEVRAIFPDNARVHLRFTLENGFPCVRTEHPDGRWFAKGPVVASLDDNGRKTIVLNLWGFLLGIAIETRWHLETGSEGTA